MHTYTGIRDSELIQMCNEKIPQGITDREVITTGEELLTRNY